MPGSLDQRSGLGDSAQLILSEWFSATPENNAILFWFMDGSHIMKFWTDPKPLPQYLHASTAPGIYVIGQSRDVNLPPLRSGVSDPYLLGNWPTNFKPEYIGISQANSPGVKGRLSSHARSKGNKHIAELLKHGVNLYFIVIYGIEATGYESLYIALKSSGQFEGNKRPEHDRAAKKRNKQIRDEMSPYERQFYDHLEIESDGM